MQNIRLENMDCLDFLKTVSDNSIDLVLIDPPYEISRDTNFASGEETGRDVDRFRVSMDFGDWDKDFSALNEVTSECYRVLKDKGTFVCFYDIFKITELKSFMDDAGFKQIRFIEWIKTNPVPINSKVNYLTNAREIALTGVKGSSPTFNSEYDAGVYEYPINHERDRFHPTQKPLALIEELVLKHSNKGDTVLDCFSGSGTTMVASKVNDRCFVGCEIDREYYNKSLKRINNTLF